MLLGMKATIFIRQLSDDEQRQLKADLHSLDAFVFRRCQILLASARDWARRGTGPSTGSPVRIRSAR